MAVVHIVETSTFRMRMFDSEYEQYLAVFEIDVIEIEDPFPSIYRTGSCTGFGGGASFTGDVVHAAPVTSTVGGSVHFNTTTGTLNLGGGSSWVTITAT